MHFSPFLDRTEAALKRLLLCECTDRDPHSQDLIFSMSSEGASSDCTLRAQRFGGEFADRRAVAARLAGTVKVHIRTAADQALQKMCPSALLYAHSRSKPFRTPAV